jgi:hypothetical protein
VNLHREKIFAEHLAVGARSKRTHNAVGLVASIKVYPLEVSTCAKGLENSENKQLKSKKLPKNIE